MQHIKVVPGELKAKLASQYPDYDDSKEVFVKKYETLAKPVTLTRP